MTVYEAREHYRDPAVAEGYDRQFRAVRGPADLRAALLGRFEERAFAAMLAGVAARGTVLDVACGTGRYVRHLLAAGFTVTGSDVSGEMLAIARRRTPPGARLLALDQADAARLPFQDGQFDGVTCMRLYHRVPAETRREMLAEVRRVARAWAVLFFGMTNRWLALRRRLRAAGGGRPTDPHPLTMDALRAELAAAGMELRGRAWVLPGLADGMIVRVGW